MQQRRRLPHQYPEGRALFITWHLHGSLPASHFPVPHNLSAGQAFVWIDRYLDTTRHGPRWMKMDGVARVVVEGIRFAAAELHYFDLEAYAIMADHVHILVWPHAPPSRFLKSIKGYSAREANKILGLTGQPFWQRESYEHWVRDSVELEKIRRYIEQNPVKAGLVTRAEEYRWSSAYGRRCN